MKALKGFLALWLTAVTVVGFSFPIVAHPQNWWEFPNVPALGDRARILFFHVPMAWVTVIAFIVAMIYGIKYLVSKNIDYDIKSVASAGLGLMFCILATVTGSLWAKFNWGSFWNWDPRETSIFVLLLIYCAYFALRSAVDVSEKRAALGAVYSILAGITVPFFIFIMPRILDSLHPDPIINTRGKIDMNPTMLIVFLASLAGFTALYFWMWNLKVRLERIAMKNERILD
jgi:heme exporter protein C